MIPNTGVTARDLSTSQRLDILRRARHEIARNPKNVHALVTAASVLGIQNSVDEAIAMLQKALSVRKKDPEILMRLIALASENFNFTVARKYARKLTEAQPRNADGFKLYGLALENSGMPKQAIQAYQRAERLAPGSAQTLHDIGRCHSFLGDHRQAIEYYEMALTADPNYSYALYTLANARKFTTEEAVEFVGKVEAAIPHTEDDAIRANIHYAAGKVLEDAGRHEEAFDWYSRANAIRRPQVEKPIAAPFQNARSTFTGEFFKTRGSLGHESDRPIFILGLPRSGTTLVESLLGAHSNITACDEIRALGTISKRLGRDSEAEGAYRHSIRALDAARVRALADEYLQETRVISGNTPQFTDKLPHNFLNVGLIHLVFPHARIIHCRRHPVANCFSLYSNSMTNFHNGYKTDLIRLGMYYRQYAQLMEHWRETLPGVMHEVFYEDVVANTEANARGMLDYLAQPWEDNVLDRGKQRSVRTLSGWQVRQPIYKSSREKWRNFEVQLQPLIEAIGPYVEEYEELLAGMDRNAAGRRND